MIGLTSYGAYIPWYRLNREIILQQMSWFNSANAAYAKGEKAVANHDEDVITMGYAAARNCLDIESRQNINGLYLSSLSLPFAQRQNAVVIADALALRSDIRSADFTSSLRSGTTALLAALDHVSANEDSALLVCASECRVPKPGSAQEYTYGDGAAAVGVGSKNVIAEFKGSYSLSYDFIDSRRLNNEKFEHGWEERWIRDEGYLKIIPKVIRGLTVQSKLTPTDFSSICIACPSVGALKAFPKLLGVQPEVIEDNLVGVIGDTGAAMPLLMLAAALEKAKPGDKILLVSFGYGADAMYFEVTEEINKARYVLKKLADQLNKKEALGVYSRYLANKNLLELEMGTRGESISPTAMTVLWQQGRTISSLEGVRCKVCGTPQYPRHKVCVNPQCVASGQMEPYSFSDKHGKVVSFTADYLAFSWDPPQLYGMVDFEGGGRIFLDFTDCKAKDVMVDMVVETTFRRKYVDPNRGYHGYYWKVKPVL